MQAQTVKAPRALPTHPIATREKAFQLYKLGNSAKEIGTLVNIKEGTIRVWIRNHKWKARALAENAGDVVTPVPCYLGNNAEQHTLAEKQGDYEQTMSEQALRLPRMMATLSDRELLASADKIAKLDATNRKALKLESDKPGIVVNVALLAGTQAKRLLGRSPATSDNSLPTINIVPHLTSEGKAPAQVEETIETPTLEAEEVGGGRPV